MIEMKRRSRSVGGLLGLLAAAMLLSACIQRNVDLSFETIDKGLVPRGVSQGEEIVSSKRYEEKEPKLVVIATIDEVPSLSPYVFPLARPELDNTDLRAYFVIAVFQGWKPILDYEARIERIVYRDRTVRVFAEFVEPVEGQMMHPAASSPYHVVRVEKPAQLAGREVRFILVANGQEIASETRQLP